MTEAPAPDPFLRFAGWLLVLVGGLMAGLCGLCTAGFVVAGLVNAGDVGLSVMSFLIGIVPTAIGLGLFMAGRAILKPPKPPSLR